VAFPRRSWEADGPGCGRAALGVPWVHELFGLVESLGAAGGNESAQKKPGFPKKPGRCLQWITVRGDKKRNAIRASFPPVIVRPWEPGFLLETEFPGRNPKQSFVACRLRPLLRDGAGGDDLTSVKG
jgi:hypothetical protein